MDSFKNRLQTAMDLRDLRPIDLANKMGINRGLVSQYLKGYFEPNKNKIYEISQILNVNPAWLMGFDVPMEAETELISKDEYIEQAYKLIDKSNLEEDKKELLKQNIKFICK